MTTIPDMEAAFEPLRDTHTPDELAALKEARHYGHDLAAAIARGNRRRTEAAFSEAEKWVTETIKGISWTRARPLEPGTLFWHMLCWVCRRARESGVPKEVIIERLERQAHMIERD